MERKGILQDIVATRRQHEGLMGRNEEGGEVVEKVDHQHTELEERPTSRARLTWISFGSNLNKFYRQKFKPKEQVLETKI